MSARCSVCGSHALNIAPSSGLCDVHFYKVQRDELLEALRNAVASLGGITSDNVPEMARAAIAKAVQA